MKSFLALALVGSAAAFAPAPMSKVSNFKKNVADVRCVLAKEDTS